MRKCGRRRKNVEKHDKEGECELQIRGSFWRARRARGQNFDQHSWTAARRVPGEVRFLVSRIARLTAKRARRRCCLSFKMVFCWPFRGLGCLGRPSCARAFPELPREGFKTQPRNCAEESAPPFPFVVVLSFLFSGFWFLAGPFLWPRVVAARPSRLRACSA